jgi:hypothetical protein
MLCLGLFFSLAFVLGANETLPLDSEVADPPDSFSFTKSHIPSPALSDSFHRPPATTDATDQEWSDLEEEEEQRRLTISVAVFLIFIVVSAISLYLYCQRRINAENNTEYTRPILGDDVYEFSQLENT